MQWLARVNLSQCMAAAIVAAWCVTALHFGQSILATQKSSQLLHIGAANGDIFVTHEYWRLVVSQFLHVHFPHMLFNAGCIVIIGSALEKASRWHGLLIVYIVGGTAGQIASVVSYPTLVSSGASQALMALCAALLVAKSRSRWLALAIVAIQVALDVYVAGTIKIGHGAGFVAGLLIAIAILVKERLRNRNTNS